jgi:hypothetical protein
LPRASSARKRAISQARARTTRAAFTRKVPLCKFGSSLLPVDHPSVAAGGCCKQCGSVEHLFLNCPDRKAGKHAKIRLGLMTVNGSADAEDEFPSQQQGSGSESESESDEELDDNLKLFVN